jgi:hypothetical protein
VRRDAIAGESLVEGELLESLEGELKSVENDAISVETSTGKGKKQQLKLNRILFKHIKSTSVQIKF